MIRVLHLIDHLGLGGAQSALLDLAGCADQKSFHIEVAVMHGRGMFFDELESRGIKVHCLAPRKWPPVYIKNLVRLLRRSHYDVLHFHLQGSNWLAKPLSAVFSGAKRLAHDHSSADLSFRGWQSLLPDSLAHCFSHKVVAVSQGVADFLCRCESVPAGKIAVVPNGVDTEFFQPATPEQRERARRVLGVERGRFVAGSLGRLAPEKNFRSLAEVARDEPGIDFLVGGDGPEHVALMKSSSAVKNFRLLGRVSDRRTFYAAVDIFVLPSLHEALPMTLLEAMASGVPVVASHLEGIASALGETGILVSPGDNSALGQAVRFLAAEPASAAKLAASAREKVVGLYDARIAADKIGRIYRELLE